MIKPKNRFAYISYISYIFARNKKRAMEAAIIPKKRKVIDIPEDIFKYLSIKAAANGMNLKRYIENLIAKDVEDIDDSATYRQLIKNDPEGLSPASEEEQQAFRKWLEAERQITKHP